MRDIFQLIRDANQQRAVVNLPRRIIKLVEELGEVSEAYLNVTSSMNGKGKSWDDVREEIADVLIVAVDIAMTPMQTFTPPNVMLNAIDWTTLGETPIPFAEFDATIFEVINNLAGLQRLLKEGHQAEAAVSGFYLALAAVDLAVMQLPDQVDLGALAVRQNLQLEVVRKLGKWERARQKQSDVTEFVAVAS